MGEFTEREDCYDSNALHYRKARTMALFLTNEEVERLVTVEDAIEVLEPTFAPILAPAGCRAVRARSTIRVSVTVSSIATPVRMPRCRATACT